METSNYVYFAKEVAKMLEIDVIEVRVLAKFFKVSKIYGQYRFSPKDIQKIKRFIEGTPDGGSLPVPSSG